MDRSFRYTVDKTTREVLFLPLPSQLRQEVKPFVDVTVDRVSRGLGALLHAGSDSALGPRPRVVSAQLRQPGAGRAVVLHGVPRQAGYLASFRRSIEQRVVRPEEVRLSGSELSTVESLVQELAHPDPARVVYAIDVLESLDKRNLVTPLLLYHESPVVRVRALGALGAARTDIAEQLGAAHPPHAGRFGSRRPRRGNQRADRHQSRGCGYTRARRWLLIPTRESASRRRRRSPKARSADDRRCRGGDVRRGHRRYVQRNAGRETRRRGRHPADGRSALQRLLIPLFYDPVPEVADEAMMSVRASGSGDFVFVPTLVALLRHRRLKGQRTRGARQLRRAGDRRRSRTSCAIRTKTSGYAAISRRRWR